MPSITGGHHVASTVRDADRSAEFYRDPDNIQLEFWLPPFDASGRGGRSDPPHRDTHVSLHRSRRLDPTPARARRRVRPVARGAPRPDPRRGRTAGGLEFGTGGDALFVVFDSAGTRLLPRRAQHALAAYAWPDAVSFACGWPCTRARRASSTATTSACRCTVAARLCSAGSRRSGARLRDDSCARARRAGRVLGHASPARCARPARDLPALRRRARARVPGPEDAELAAEQPACRVRPPC